MGRNPGGQIGTVLFNFAYVVTVPSWANEKRDGVSARGTLWAALGIGTAYYVAIGLCGAAALTVGAGADILAILSSPPTTLVARVATYLFPWSALVSSIPVYGIVVRYNLVSNGICGRRWALWWSVGFPWVAAMALIAGDLLDVLVTWGSLLTTVPLNFILPCALFWLSYRKPAAATATATAGGGGGTGHLPLPDEEGQPVVAGPAIPAAGADGAFRAASLPFSLSRGAAVQLAGGLAIACAAINVYALVFEVAKDA